MREEDKLKKERINERILERMQKKLIQYVEENQRK